MTTDDSPRAGDDASPAPRPGIPRWVAVSATIGLVLLVLLVVLLLTGGEHGPGRHLSGLRPAGAPMSTSASAGGIA